MKDRSDDPSHHERTLLPRSPQSVSAITGWGSGGMVAVSLPLNPDCLYQWFFTWVRSNTRGSLSQSQGFATRLFSTIPFFKIHVLLVLFFEHSDFVCKNGARCSFVVRAVAHGAMGRRIDPSWGGPIELFLVQASAPRLV